MKTLFRTILAVAALAVGLRAHGESLETKSIQSAIDAASVSGSGRVVVPTGRHVTGQLYLKSNVELHLEEGAVLEGAAGLHNYVVHALPYSEGTWSAVVMGLGVTNVAITGRGEIFGNGAAFESVKTVGVCKEGFRPRGVLFADCENVRLEDFKLRDAACWGIVLKRCNGVTARRVRIDSHVNLNNDGFDIEAANVLVESCDVDCGDDAFCIKSNDPGFVVGNVIVSNCVARSHCNGYKLGTASHGTMRNIRVVNCRTEAPRRVYRDLAPMPVDLTRWHPVDGAPTYLTGPGVGAICVECVDGGVVENVCFKGVSIGGFQVPIFVRGGLRMKRTCGIPPSDRRILRNVVIEDVNGVAERAIASSVTGVPGCIPSGIVLRNIDIECVGAGEVAGPFETPGRETWGLYPEAIMFERYRLPCFGLFIDHAEGVALENVCFTLREGTCDSRPSIFRGGDKALPRQEGSTRLP